MEDVIMSELVVGIDLGTSSCSVARMTDGKPQILPAFAGHDEMPTYVAFTADGERLVGWAAKRQAIMNPANTIFTIKRLIGRKFASAATQAELGLLPYRVIPSAAGGLWVEAGGRSYTPTEITAIMLVEVRRAIEAYLDREVTSVVLTVPAYFDEEQRRATKSAAEIAGLEVLRLIAEPTAAALAYGMGGKQSEIIAVYDLGGGTFDISILEIGDGVFDVKAVNGDNRLGGEDFDHCMVRYFIEEIKQERGMDLASDPLALHRIKDAAEQLKIQLDVVQTATVQLPYLAVRKGEFVHADLKLTRTKLDELLRPLIDKTLVPCSAALKDAGLTANDLNALVLVGGMSRMPGIRRRVAEFFGVMPKGHMDPSRVVAYGAAIQAAVLQGDIRDILLLDVVPISLGFCDHNGKFVAMIDKNTNGPTKKSVRIPPIDTMGEQRNDIDADALIAVGNLKILQGEFADAKDDLLIGEIPIGFAAARPGERAKVEITFDVDANYTLVVSIKNWLTGEERAQRIMAVDPFARDRANGQVSTVRLTEEELAAARAQADDLLNIVDAAIKMHGQQVRSDVFERIERARGGLQRAMQSRDAAELVGALAEFSAAADIKSRPKKAAPIPPPVAVTARESSRCVFISYARADRPWLDRLRLHLTPLERSGKIEIWHDGKIDSGAPWALDIDRALARAAIAILLVSAHFKASTFIYENELPPILERNRVSGLSIFPVFIDHCFYQHDSMLSRLNAFNDPKRPFSAMTNAEAEAEFARLASDVWQRLGASG
jgi:molecular chaperone DnaK